MTNDNNATKRQHCFENLSKEGRLKYQKYHFSSSNNNQDIRRPML